MGKKRCRYCGRWFQPDPRTARFQKACPRKRCRVMRKDQAQARWLAANPDAFRGLYIKTRRWLSKHPGYLKRYRLAHPAYVAADKRGRRERRVRQRRRADIQDAIPRREIRQIQGVQGADIQAAIDPDKGCGLG